MYVWYVHMYTGVCVRRLVTSGCTVKRWWNSATASRSCCCCQRPTTFAPPPDSPTPTLLCPASCTSLCRCLSLVTTRTHHARTHLRSTCVCVIQIFIFFFASSHWLEILGRLTEDRLSETNTHTPTHTSVHCSTKSVCRLQQHSPATDPQTHINTHTRMCQ